MKIVIATSLIALLTAAGCKETKPTFDPERYLKEQESAENMGKGRYQLVQLGQMARDQYIFDTAEGRIWRANCRKPGKGSQCNDVAWEQEERLDFKK